MVRPAASRAGLLRVAAAGLLLAAALASVGGLSSAHAREPFDVRVAPVIAVAGLPPQAQLAYATILAGGPFRHESDGAVFFNRERLLPPARRGYYREYTVATPGSRRRGARRIVCGGVPPALPDACYYTNDHYASFRMILP